MSPRSIVWLLASFLLALSASPAFAQYYRRQYPSGRIFGELTYSDTTSKSDNSMAVDEVRCVARLDFFSNGWLKYWYSYSRVATQTWDHSHTRGRTPYRIDIRRVSYFSGDLEIPADRAGTITGTSRVNRRPFSDSIPGNQQFIEYQDGSVDFNYSHPGRIPLVMLAEKIHIGWDGRTDNERREWKEASAHCDPYINVWLQQTALRTTRGSFDSLTGSVDKILPGTTHRVRVIWSLERPPAR